MNVKGVQDATLDALVQLEQHGQMDSKFLGVRTRPGNIWKWSFEVDENRKLDRLQTTLEDKAGQLRQLAEPGNHRHRFEPRSINPALLLRDRSHDG